MAGTKRESAQNNVQRAHFSEHFYSSQSRRERRENYQFSFAAETPANENQHAFGKL